MLTLKKHGLDLMNPQFTKQNGKALNLYLFIVKQVVKAKS